MVRIGLIGFGQQGKLYAAILSGTPLPGMPPIAKPEDCALTAISARNIACKEQIEGLGVRYFQNWEDMVASDACDAVVITVSTGVGGGAGVSAGAGVFTGVASFWAGFAPPEPNSARISSSEYIWLSS